MLNVRTQPFGHHDAAVDGIDMPRQCWRDCVELGALILKQQESIKCHQRPAKAHRNALARMGTDSDPVKTPVDSPSSGLRTDPADANDGIKSTPANGAHTVLAPKDTVFVWIERMRPLIDQDSDHSQTSCGMTASCTCVDRSAINACHRVGPMRRAQNAPAMMIKPVSTISRSSIKSLSVPPTELP